MRNLKFSGLLAIVATVLAACGAEPPMEVLDNPLSGLSALDTTEVEAILHQHIAVLASDEYEGRAPATPGEEKTISYLQREFSALGIQPGNGDSYFQSVSVTETTTASDAVLMLEGSDYQVALSYGDQMMVSSQQQIPAISVLDSELIFVGYGVVAPERSWNDYAGIDVTDKTVVILVNDPGYATQNPNIFNGNAMTYYAVGHTSMKKLRDREQQRL